jgi:Flp pilus assembly protein TadD
MVVKSAAFLGATMSRNILGILALVAATAGMSAAVDAAAQQSTVPAPPKTTASAVIDEAALLSAAVDAAKNGDKNGAIQLYQSAIIYSPSDPVPYQRLAQFFAENRETLLAQQYYDLALDVQPVYAPALAGLAILDLAAGDRAGAEAEHDVLLHACGKNCPETAQVEKAMGGVDIGSSAK